MLPHSKWLFVFLVALGAEASQAEASQAEERKPAWRELPGDWSTRLIISDPLPHLRRVLGSETLRKTLTEGMLAKLLEESQQQRAAGDGGAMSRLAEVLGMANVRENLDPKTWLSAIESRAAFIPEEIVLAAPGAADGAVGDWFHAILLWQLTPPAVRLNDHAGELQDAVIELLRRAKLPRLTLRVRFRDPALPNLVFAQAKALVQQLVPANWRTTIEARGLGIKQQLGSVYQDDVLQSILVALGFAAAGDDKLPAMSQAAGKLELEMWLEQAGNDLVVTFGERLKSQKLTGKELGPLWSDDDGRVLFATWRSAGFKQRIHDSAALLKRFADSPAGKAAADADENDFLGTLRRMDERLVRAADSGSASLTLDSSLELRAVTQGSAPVPPLSESPLLKLVPQDVEQVSLTMVDSLGSSLVAMLDNFEDRLETRSLQYDLSGKANLASQLQKLRAYYYGEMEDVRRLVFDEGPKVFEPPLATLFGASGRIERLQVSLHLDGARQMIELRNVPSPEYAVIAAARDLDSATHFIADLAERMREHLRGSPAGEGRTPEPRPIDVGLGVPTFGFGTLGSSATGSDGQEQSWRVEAEGDVLPHYFAHERFVVVSSSVRLSKAILAAGRRPANRLTLPRPDSGELIAYGQCPADLFARLIEQIASWSEALANEKQATIEGDLFESFRPTIETSETLSRLLAGLAEIVRLVDRAEWQTSQSAKGRTSRMTILPRE